jgi:hypothetical protein
MITISSELEKEYIEIATQLQRPVEELINRALTKELRMQKNLIERRNKSLDEWLDSIDKNGTTVLYPSSCDYHRDFQNIEFDNIILCSNGLRESSKIGKVLSIKVDNNELLGALRRRNIKLNAVVIICDGCREGGNYECCAETPFIKKLIPLMSEDFSFYSDHGKFHKVDFINSGNDVLIEAIDVPHFVNVFRQRSSGNIRDILGWKMKAATQNSSVITATVSNFANIEIREYSDDICNANISTGELFIEYNNKFDPESHFAISSQFEGIRYYLNGLSQSDTNNITSIRQTTFTKSKGQELNDYKFMLKKANDEKIETVTYLSYLADGHREIYEYLESWRGEYPKKLNLFSLKSKGFNQ